MMSVIVKRSAYDAYHLPSTGEIIINLYGIGEEEVEACISRYFLGEWLCLFFKEHGFTRECIDNDSAWKAHHVIGCRPFHVVDIIEDELRSE